MYIESWHHHYLNYDPTRDVLSCSSNRCDFYLGEDKVLRTADGTVVKFSDQPLVALELGVGKVAFRLGAETYLRAESNGNLLREMHIDEHEKWTAQLTELDVERRVEHCTENMRTGIEAKQAQAEAAMCHREAVREGHIQDLQRTVQAQQCTITQLKQITVDLQAKLDCITQIL